MPTLIKIKNLLKTISDDFKAISESKKKPLDTGSQRILNELNVILEGLHQYDNRKIRDIELLFPIYEFLLKYWTIHIGDKKYQDSIVNEYCAALTTRLSGALKQSKTPMFSQFIAESMSFILMVQTEPESSANPFVYLESKKAIEKIKIKFFILAENHFKAIKELLASSGDSKDKSNSLLELEKITSEKIQVLLEQLAFRRAEILYLPQYEKASSQANRLYETMTSKIKDFGAVSAETKSFAFEHTVRKTILNDIQDEPMLLLLKDAPFTLQSFLEVVSQEIKNLEVKSQNSLDFMIAQESKDAITNLKLLIEEFKNKELTPAHLEPFVHFLNHRACVYLAGDVSIANQVSEVLADVLVLAGAKLNVPYQTETLLKGTQEGITPEIAKQKMRESFLEKINDTEKLAATLLSMEDKSIWKDYLDCVGLESLTQILSNGHKNIDDIFRNPSLLKSHDHKHNRAIIFAVSEAYKLNRNLYPTTYKSYSAYFFAKFTKIPTLQDKNAAVESLQHALLSDTSLTDIDSGIDTPSTNLGFHKNSFNDGHFMQVRELIKKAAKEQIPSLSPVAARS